MVQFLKRQSLSLAALAACCTLGTYLFLGESAMLTAMSIISVAMLLLVIRYNVIDGKSLRVRKSEVDFRAAASVAVAGAAIIFFLALLGN
ncbi:hypothetical protein [Flavihumibacter petaseus]|uniref:Uncharacterized protein n=1 Tax=Flavihumibacter petaseus NBRC 106054 TaxID=1220578 RepID=A0A0E9MYU9_9BACT|nr:hypothetical protein [Flavihumibacter petaseus]GAO42576.1 hypothetical protein FPE01S_01_15910 [Flavihumibacter petaseus NBRC 106054]